jgi:hypothetical protein
VRCIEHGNLMEPRSIPLFKKYGAFYVPTLVTYHCLARKSRDGLLPGDIAAKLADVIGGAMSALAMAHEAGLPIVYGTDLFADMPPDHGWAAGTRRSSKAQPALGHDTTYLVVAAIAWCAGIAAAFAAITLRPDKRL